LSEIRLQTVHYLARVGDVIFPPPVAYYAPAASIKCGPPRSKEVTIHVVGRVIAQLGIEHSLINRWQDDQHPIPVNGDRQLAKADDRTTRLGDKLCRPHGR
jgi:4-hydroxy-3-polyprenylbenzoate decarboxylase